MEVRDTDGVAGVAHEPDDLTRRHLRSELHHGWDAPRCRRSVLDAVNQIVGVHMEVVLARTPSARVIMMPPEIPRSSSWYRRRCRRTPLAAVDARTPRMSVPSWRRSPCSPRGNPTHRCSGWGQGPGTPQAETHRSVARPDPPTTRRSTIGNRRRRRRTRLTTVRAIAHRPVSAVGGIRRWIRRGGGCRVSQNRGGGCRIGEPRGRRVLRRWRPVTVRWWWVSTRWASSAAVDGSAAAGGCRVSQRRVGGCGDRGGCRVSQNRGGCRVGGRGGGGC